MAVYKRDMVDINLETGNIHRSFLKHSIGYKDAAADHFGIRAYRNGEPVNLTGVSIQGIFMPPQGSPIAITSGNIVNYNEAEVVLPQACYNYNGQFTLAIKLVDPSNAVTGTMRIIDGMVDNTNASGTVAPVAAIPSYQEVLSTYEQAIAAINKTVRFDAVQSLTDTQKATARSNISAPSVADLDAEEAAREAADTAFSNKIGNTALPTTAQTITGAIAEHETDINGINSEIGNTTLPTTAQTLTGAIAEHDTDIQTEITNRTNADNDLKSAITSIAQEGIKRNLNVTWTKGAINSSTGASTTSNIRIRTATVDRSDYTGVAVNTGYKCMVFVYDENAVYQGVYTGEGYKKEGHWLTEFTSLLSIPIKWKLRFVVSRTDESTSIATTDNTNFFVYTPTDTSLAQENKMADAKAVGDKFADIADKIGGESVNLHDSNSDTIGAYWNDDFEEITETGTTYYRHTALIDISAYDYIKWENGSSASYNHRCWFVDENNTGIESFGMSSSGTLDIPANAKYVTFTAGKNNTSLTIYGGTNGNILDGFADVDEKILSIKKGNGEWLFDGDWQIGRLKPSNGGIDSTAEYSAAIITKGLTLPAGTEVVADPYWCFRISYYDDENVRHQVDDASVYILPYNAHTIRISVNKVDADTSETAILDTWKTHVHWCGAESEYERIKGESFSIAMFKKWGVVGDSYGEGGHSRSWGSILAGMLGNADGFTNFSKSGISTSTYIDSQYGLLKLLAAEPKEFYWLQLGINDSSRVKSDPSYLGSISDISGSYEDYPDTFYGNYGHIIEAIKAHSPNAAFVMATALFGSITGTVASTASTNLPPVNAAIKEIAEHYGIPCIEILDDPFIYSQLYTRMMGASGTGNHPVVAAYPAVAQAYNRLFSKCVVDNYEYFRAIEYD